MKCCSAIHLLSLILPYGTWLRFVTAAGRECQPALGMESGAISDAQISASSQHDSEHGPKNARLRNTQGKGSWVAGVHDVNQWLQVDLAGLNIVTGIATQGRHSEHSMWVTKYKLQYSNDGASFQFYKQQGQNVDKEFAGNTDEDTAVYYDLSPPIIARYILFRPVTWYRHIAMRVELYDCQEECQPALGMESGAVFDEQISASSEYDNSLHTATRGRLRLPGSASSAGSWTTTSNNADEWLQIDLKTQGTKVSGVATQGRDTNAYEHWVTKYKLEYSNDEVRFQYYRDQGQTVDKEFTGNTDQNTVVYHTLNPPIRARYIRFRPVAWKEWIAMRVELYDCLQGEIVDFWFSNGVGIGSPNVIPDDHMTASSHFNSAYQSFYGRLLGGGAWCAKTSNSNDDWLQVDLGRTFQLSAVATQGDKNGKGGVTVFKLSYSIDGINWKIYQDENSTDWEFHRQGINDTIDRQKFQVAVSARYIRFHPIQQYGWNCLRVEAYIIEECQEALGMETGIISDGQISASSEASAAIQGRLHFQETVDKAGGWAVATSDANQWLQVDLGRQLAKVTRVATQGRNGPHIQLVTKYKLQYSNDGVNFQNYTEQEENIDKEFTGNTDQDTVVYHVLNPPIRARYIRFRPLAWYGWISMRVELYGCLQDSCRSLKFASPVDGFALEGHVIKNISLHTGMRSSCIGRCSMESKCMSFNIGPPIDNHAICQLSDSDHTTHPGDLRPQEGFTYRATESPYSSNVCFNDGTCILNGFADKGYVCICQTGYRGENCEIVARTCKELYNNNLAEGDRAYPLKMKNVILPVYCHMTDDLGACGGGGWTLVMKIDGKEDTFHFDSPYWSDKRAHNLLEGEKGLNGKETKLPTYWNTPFSKICLGMRIGPNINFIVIDKEANSLHSLIADGQYRATSLGRDTWKSLIGFQGTLQTACGREGFNNGCFAGASKARIGIVANNVQECGGCDSRVGFGTGGYIDDTNTCGNVGPASSDNGEKNFKGMGYILVQ